MRSLTLELYPENGQIRPYEVPYGYIFRGVIMNWLSKIRPNLVHKLHDYEQIRPYSIKRYIHKHIPKIDFTVITYDDSISDVLLKNLLNGEKPQIKIADKIYFISQINFEKIDFSKFLDDSKMIKSFNVKFATPTYFNTSMGNYPVRFPLPALFFGNLANIWNDISRNYAEIDREAFIDWVNAHVYISYYKMKTVRWEIGKSKSVYGCVGSAGFRVKKDE